MPDLQKRINETIKQLQDIQTHEITLGEKFELLDFRMFTKEMENNLENLNIPDKRKIIKLLVKEILVDHETIHIRHSIPVREVKHGDEKKVINCVRG
ncbi:MAG: hypothetical protein U5K79_23690 [Cyclobacteriaceae bacterium]|nr:hypothetical protein [Cyclobacteriaceae bacterium]